MSKWLKISHKGELSYVDLPDSRGPCSPFLDGVYRELDCSWVGFVRVNFFGDQLCLMVDECGKLKDGWQDRINFCASLMYAPGEDVIVGDVILGRFEWCGDGDNVVPCSPEFYRDFVRKMVSAFTDITDLTEVYDGL